MPYLAYESDGTPRAGRLTGRALIGRRLSHGVVLDDTAVSRLHAWVEPNAEGGWTVADAGSKNGLAVNNRKVDRQTLADGDVIRVGSTRITFHATDDVPPAAEPVSLSPPPGEPVRTSGILFACEHCASPIWVGVELVGKRGRCRHCKQQVVVPAPAVLERPTDAPAAGRRPQCGVCHSAIGGGEAIKACPECDTTYHAECWTENFGCSTYGCGQVDVLNPATAKPALPASMVEPATMRSPDPEAPIEGEHDEPDEVPTQWEWYIVLGTLVASVLGNLAFGAPALAMGIVALVMVLRRHADTRVGVLLLAILIAVVGTAVGLAGSDFLYLNGAHLPR